MRVFSNLRAIVFLQKNIANFFSFFVKFALLRTNGRTKTDDCIQTLATFLCLTSTRKKFNHYAPEPLIAAIEIVMRNNRFKFGDVLVKQIQGIAMGISPAPPIANLFVAIHEEELINPADCQLIPSISTNHWYKESMTTSKETKDDAEMLALVEEARRGDLIYQQRRTNNNMKKATLDIKILLKQLRRLIVDMVTDITMMIVIERNKFVQTRSQTLTKGNTVLVLNEKELSDVIARELKYNFCNADALLLKVASTTYLHDECSTYLGYNAHKDKVIKSKLETEDSGETESSLTLLLKTGVKRYLRLLPTCYISKKKDS